MLRKMSYTLAAFGLAASIASAHAGTLSYSGYSLLNGQNVHLKDTALGIDETVGAGQITLQHINGGNTSLATFCIDIADWLQSPGSFTTGTFVTGALGTTVNALLTHVAPSQELNASAALQVAIWKAEYGSALTVSGNDTVTNQASTYLGNISSGLWQADPSMQVLKLDGNGSNQSQAYLARVPEPATLAYSAPGYWASSPCSVGAAPALAWSVEQPAQEAGGERRERVHCYVRVGQLAVDAVVDGDQSAPAFPR